MIKQIIPVVAIMMLLTSCGSPSVSDVVVSDDNTTVETTSVQTDISLSETSVSVSEQDDVFHPNSDKALFPYGVVDDISVDAPLGEEVLDEVTVNADFFENSNVRLLYNDCNSAIYETYTQMVFDNESYDVDHSLLAYDVAGNKATAHIDDDTVVLCDGESTYVIMPGYNSYVKRNEVTLDFVNFVIGFKDNNVADAFSHSGEIVKYNGKEYKRFKLCRAESTSYMDYDIISYYYFNDDGNAEYNVEFFGDRLITATHIEQLAESVDDDYFTCPVDYTEVQNDEIMESLFSQWGIHPDSDTVG